jgi:hypothetical protein
MAPRRRITTVVDQQRRLRELGRIRFGEPKQPNCPGRPIEFPRVTSSQRDVVDEVAAVYGGEVTAFQPVEAGPPQWQVHVQGPLGIAVPPDIPAYTMAYEQWAGGVNTVRCDGDMCQFRKGGRWVERACVCEERGQDFKERPCKRTVRMSVMIVGVRRLGVFRVDTKSFHAAETVPTTLDLLQLSGRPGWMSMVEQTDLVMEWDEKAGQDKPVRRRYRVIAVSADFHVDEVMHLERPASMAALPAPDTRLLPRGTRPQLGPGASIDPVGPQPGDRQPPPRAVPPVDLDAPVTGEIIDEGEGDPAADAAWDASAAPEQAALPLDEPRVSAPGDA